MHLARFNVCPVVVCTAVLSTACGQPAAPPAPMTTSSATSTSAASGRVDPARIVRARGELPAGYEVTDLSGPTSPITFWGFGPGSVAEPPQCAVLGNPTIDESTVAGWSASGPGGIVHAVVAVSPPVDPAVLTECGQWTVVSGNTTGDVTVVDAPPVDGATTVGMTTTAKTVVEGGTETSSTASTFSAYVGDYLTFVTVVTDPGSPQPPLGQDFAASLLVKTVAALRG